ncbi:retrovirus-related pol polyprotein from transposon TNT 1-94 [Tanacetum coccineum]
MAVNHFFIHGEIPPGCNSSFIALIPKVPDANLVKDFRPISLIGSIYKIIAKIFFKWPFNASGLKINLNKSKIMGINVESAQVIQAAAKLGCLVLKCPFYYLGTRVGGSMTRVQAWQEIVEKVKSRLSKWKSKTLSIGGRLTLLKSVLGSIPVFHMSIFKVPSKKRGIFKDTFPRLYALESSKDVTVSSKIGDTSLVCSFRRIPRGGIEQNQFDSLVELVRSVTIVHSADRWNWNLESTGVKPSTSARGSQPSGNTKKDKIQQTPSITLKNKVEAHSRTVKSSFKNKNCVVEPNKTANVQHSKLNANSKLLCVKCNGCMLSDNHDLCVLDFINDVNACAKSKFVKKSSKRKAWKPTGKVFINIGYIWRPTGRTFTIVENACPFTRITTTTEVPLRKLTSLKSDTPKHVVTLVYSRKPKKSKTNVTVSKPKIINSKSANNKEPSKSWRSIVSDVPSSPLDECRNDHVAKILGYGDYQIGNVTISRVYYVEGLGHNLFSVGQFCDSNFEVAFCQHTCFIRNLEGVDLLTGSRGNNLYTLSLGDMMTSSPICLPKLNFEKDHLCSACAMGKSKKKPYKPKSEDTNQEKLYLLYMDLCGPMRVASVNGKKYILVTVDDYSRFTWVKCLRSKDKAPDFIIKFLKMIQVQLKAPVRRI